MNASIQGIIDHMFRDTIDNAETRALHEELLNNCLEHYNDLIQRGMSETEAIDAVVDSLKGMKEVIDEYPKKPGVQDEKKEDRQEVPVIQVGESEKKEPVQEKPSEYVYHAAEVRRLRTDLKNCDLIIRESRDNLIHVHCEDMEQLQCQQDGDRLSIRILDQTKQSIDEAGQKFSSQEFSLRGLLNFIGKTIGSVASTITVSWNVYVDLPAAPLEEMDLNGKSGDIDVKATLPRKLTAHSMSGDVTVKATDDQAAEQTAISTMSGDAEFSGNTARLSISSMSGDVKAYGVFRDVELKSTSGDAQISGEAEKFQIHSVSGDVTIKPRNTSVESIQAHSTSGDVDISLAPGTDSVHVSMSTVSGSTRCAVQDSGAGARLQIQAKSVSGDVTIR